MTERTPSRPTTGQPTRTATTGVLQVVDLTAAEHDWEISPGMIARGYAFNGRTPGPVIEARVGDTLLVQFTNLLPEPTTIRWHGLPEPTAMNGRELAADPVPPGGRLQCQVHLPHAGTFCYHSLTTGTTQSRRGLGGVLVVSDPEEPPFDGERVLLFDDLALAATDHLPEHRRPSEADLVLVNGVLEHEMEIPTRHVERWRLVNLSARALRLSLGDHQFRTIRTGGHTSHGLDEVLIASGDRLDLAVGPFSDGETVVLQGLSYDRRVGESLPRPLATLYVAPSDRS